jgi:hypothetical protein
MQYRAIASRMAREAEQKGLSARACDNMQLRINVHLNRRDFTSALALLLQFRTKSMPAPFLLGTGHWITMLRDEQRGKAKLFKF